jgi:hypothetical protein
MGSMTLKTPSAVTGSAVAELVTEATAEALNRALSKHGIDASQIITVLDLPAQPLANNVPARFRVLYRKRN